MWTVMVVLGIVSAFVVLGVRLALAGRRRPSANDPGRQAEEPGSRAAPPPTGYPTTGPDSPAVPPRGDEHHDEP